MVHVHKGKATELARGFDHQVEELLYLDAVDLAVNYLKFCQLMRYVL